jgi:hypothetical protein
MAFELLFNRPFLESLPGYVGNQYQCLWDDFFSLSHWNILEEASIGALRQMVPFHDFNELNESATPQQRESRERSFPRKETSL